MSDYSAVYRGEVVHKRFRPKRHYLRYRVFSLLLDLDELPAIDRQSRMFGYNRPRPLSFYDRDHGPLTGEPLRPWVERHLHSAGLPVDGGAIRLLCYPRIFGYVFNPLSTYFCYRRDGGLMAILYEVCNTFKERHTYVIPVDAAQQGVIKQRCGKHLYVSPFVGPDADYHFRILPPDTTVNIVIRQEDTDGLLLAASFRGTRQPFDDAVLARLLAAFPFMTLKVTAAIHWHALKLFLKGLRVFRHEAARQPVQSSAGPMQSSRY